MKDCCNHSPSDKKCIRKSDKKVFSLPRKFSKEKCKRGIKGFTMRSSCAPYKDCFKNKKKITKKRRNKMRGGTKKKDKKKTKKKKEFLHKLNLTLNSLSYLSYITLHPPQ